jgi:hypothetical protein
MTKEEEYVANALESLELAERLASSGDRRRMLKLAEAWVELATGAHDRARETPPDVAEPYIAQARRPSARPVVPVSSR